MKLHRYKRHIIIENTEFHESRGYDRPEHYSTSFRMFKPSKKAVQDYTTSFLTLEQAKTFIDGLESK